MRQADYALCSDAFIQLPYLSWEVYFCFFKHAAPLLRQQSLSSCPSTCRTATNLLRKHTHSDMTDSALVFQPRAKIVLCSGFNSEALTSVLHYSSPPALFSPKPRCGRYRRLRLCEPLRLLGSPAVAWRASLSATTTPVTSQNLLRGYSSLPE